MKSVLPAAGFLVFALASTTHVSAIAETANTQASKNQPTQVAARKSRYRGEVVFMRGGFNQFSRGLDKMSQTLNQRGVESRVVTHFERSRTVNTIAERFKKSGKKPVVLVGHSWGADSVIEVAKGLKAKGIRVDYLVTFAPTNPSPIPSNVKKATNYYFGGNGWGEAVRKGTGFRGVLKNVNLASRKTVGHFNIDKDPKVQNQVMRNILRFVRTRRSS